MKASDAAPKVSVITVNWNRRDDTLECLESAYKVDYPNYEVIVVDNGSTDGSAQAVRGNFPRAVLIANETNTGFCVANNMAVRRSLEGGADYILVINNDIIVTPSIIKELKAALDADGSIGAVSPIMAYYDRPGVFQFTGCSIDWGNGELLRRYSEEDLKRREVLDTDVISWGGALIRKEAIDAAGYLDERFFMYYDDTDWSTRCRRAGFKTLLYTKPLIYHKGSRSSGGSFSPLFYFYYTRNKVLFFRKQARALRKLQFGFNYVKHARNNYLRLSRNGEAEAAAAALDGLWSGVKGCLYEERLEMPGCIRGKLNLIDRTYLRLLTLRAVFA